MVLRTSEEASEEEVVKGACSSEQEATPHMSVP